MDEEKRFEELRESEINRLIESGGSTNPVKGILTDDEILKYAGNSEEASKIRLKRGIGSFSDKLEIHGVIMFIMWMPWGLVIVGITGSYAYFDPNIISIILFSIALLIFVGYPIYALFIKDYVEPEYKQISKPEPKELNETTASTNDDLLLLFESKEKIAREMIERRFPAPQITNTKFNSVLDNCKEVVESQIGVLNALTPTDKTKYEISSRKKLIKQLISKVDDLTNELILSEDNTIEDVIEDMDNLISSVKDY